MPFIPHTEAEVRDMLKEIGVSSIADLFDEIPADLMIDELSRIPTGMSEMEISRLMRERAAQDGTPLCFAGAGAYEHHIPSAVWQITTRGEFYTAYTPYQAEASQGTLQLLYEYQSMMAGLTAMDVSNASMYDGATALAEAVLMAVRASKKKSSRVLVPRSVHPAYRKVLSTIVSTQNIEVVELDISRQGGHLDPASLDAAAIGDFVALVIPQPNFFGVLEEVDTLTDWAHAQGSFVIGVVNPLVMSVITPPGEWGSKGADIVCGDGQPLGCPLSSGGPYFGFLCCRQELVRQMPGRIIGKTTDIDGKVGYALTLQAREQHIRRAKATSNICTNQGLLVTAATIFMALLGPTGLERVAGASHANLLALDKAMLGVPGARPVFDRACFHERAYRFDKPASEIIEALASYDIVAGYALGEDYPEFGDALLVCTTETKTAADIETFVAALKKIA